MSYEQTTYEPWSDDSAAFGCVSAREGPGVTRLTLTGELDLASVPRLWAALSSATQDAELVIVDLSALAFMDTAGVSTILAVHAQLRDQGRQLALIPGEGQVRRIFELTGAADKLPFTNDDHPSSNGNTRFPQPPSVTSEHAVDGFSAGLPPLVAVDPPHGSPAFGPNQPAAGTHTADGDDQELRAILARASRCGIDPWRVVVALGIDPGLLDPAIAVDD